MNKNFYSISEINIFETEMGQEITNSIIGVCESLEKAQEIMRKRVISQKLKGVLSNFTEGIGEIALQEGVMEVDSPESYEAFTGDKELYYKIKVQKIALIQEVA